MSSTSRSIVMGVMTSLPARGILPFLRSLRATSYRGRVCLLVARTTDDVVRELREWADDVRVLDGEFGKAESAPSLRVVSALRWMRNTRRVRRAYPAAFRWAAGGNKARRNELEYRLEGFQALRYQYYLDYLNEHAKDADRVFISDLRDVLFQDDPFAHEPAGEIETFLEAPHVTIGANGFNRKWIENLYGKVETAAIAKEVVSCSGTTMGTGVGMRKYLQVMAREVDAHWRPLCAHDQGMHNYLLRKGAFGDVKVWANGSAPVFTMGEEKSVRRDPAGRVLNYDDSVPAVVHQYDRHVDLAEPLRQLAVRGFAGQAEIVPAAPMRVGQS